MTIISKLSIIGVITSATTGSVGDNKWLLQPVNNW